MLTELHTPVWMLISQCQQLAEQLFHRPVRVRVELIPSLDGDSWRADVRAAEAPDVRPTQSAAAMQTLLAAPQARGKLGALSQLLEVLRSQAACE